jgi:hypothetical protein
MWRAPWRCEPGVSMCFIRSLFWLGFTYVTPVLVTKVLMETPGQVAITCGAANQIVRESEPSMCSYVMQMHSPAACDAEAMAAQVTFSSRTLSLSLYLSLSPTFRWLAFAPWPYRCSAAPRSPLFIDETLTIYLGFTVFCFFWPKDQQMPATNKSKGASDGCGSSTR